jgi:release factor glutamine methyltransferase
LERADKDSVAAILTAKKESRRRDAGDRIPVIRIQYPASSAGRALAQAAIELNAITDTPLLEAEILLAHVLDAPRASLLAHPERILTASQLTDYQTLARRRASGYPLPYLTGHTEFYGLTFEVTPEVLIPRPETEALVELALARRPATIVDVGTGCGCVAVALAVHLPRAAVHAIDLSPAALAVARRNVERHGVADWVRLMVGDVLSPRPGLADLIVSNPPYVSTGDCASLPISVRDHEPRLALDGGPDGLVVVRRLLAQAPAVLEPGGAILVEIGADQGEAASRLARTCFPQAAIRVCPDLAGCDRVLEIET